MYIKRVTIENVKSFQGHHEFTLGPGLNFFVGDNNSGKSTVLEALLFLFQGPTQSRWTPETFYCRDSAEPTRVAADIAGGVEHLVNQEKFKVLKDFVFEDDGEKILRLERSSEKRTVNQGNKSKSVDVKAVCFWHPEHEQFENVTGIDARVKAIFEFEEVWADAHPKDYIDFANNKTLGRLIAALFERFQETDLWTNLAAAHQRAFGAEETDSFTTQTEQLANELKGIIDEQYGKASYRFDFTLPDTSAFMKQGNLYVDDGTGETVIGAKGTGMQRAVALGLIQLYARSSALEKSESSAPLILMLDEPETWLHPNAQLRLGDALNKISDKDQVFIVTHSPYLIRKFKANKHSLTVLSRDGENFSIEPSNKFGISGYSEPSWGEINYKAFGVCSVEFHNELFGYIQNQLEKISKETNQKKDNNVKLADVDQYLKSQGIPQDRSWTNSANQKEFYVSLPVYIRNCIHHPENVENEPFTDDELLESTTLLVKIVEAFNSETN